MKIKNIVENIITVGSAKRMCKYLIGMLEIFFFFFFFLIIIYMIILLFISRNRKSLHCKYCNKCILRFDHHCKFVNNCIGVKNYRLDIYYIYNKKNIYIIINKYNI